MPNWCSNRVWVWSNDEEAMKEFKDAVSKEFSGTDKDGPWSRFQGFSFEAILPMPEELRKVQSPVTIATEEEMEEYKKKWNRDYCPHITQEESDRLDGLYDNNNWYDWSIENWGVKWDCGDVEITDLLAGIRPDFTSSRKNGGGAPQQCKYTRWICLHR